jgi:uncharacterized protein
MLRDGRDAVEKSQLSRDSNNVLITVASNGDVGPDDSLRTLNLGLFSKHNIATSTLQQVLDSPERKAIAAAENTIPVDCKECCWKAVCRGGAANGRLINRYSKARGFNNPSIVCDALQALYSRVAAYLLESGVPYEKLESNLLDTADHFETYSEDCEFSVREQVSGKRVLMLRKQLDVRV